MLRILPFLVISSLTSYSQNSWSSYSSNKYSYTIEYPSNFTKLPATGAHVDFKVADSYGNSIIVVVVPSDPRLTIDDLLSITPAQWEENSQLPNFRFIKRGQVEANGKIGMFTQWTSQNGNESPLFNSNYFFLNKGYQYVITCSCDQKELSKWQATFFRVQQSIKFK